MTAASQGTVTIPTGTVRLDRYPSASIWALQEAERIALLFIATFLLVLVVSRNIKRTVLLPLVVANPVTYLCALTVYFVSRPLLPMITVQVVEFADPLVYFAAILGSVTAAALRYRSWGKVKAVSEDGTSHHEVARPRQ